MCARVCVSVENAILFLVCALLLYCLFWFGLGLSFLFYLCVGFVFVYFLILGFFCVFCVLFYIIFIFHYLHSFFGVVF